MKQRSRIILGVFVAFFLGAVLLSVFWPRRSRLSDLPPSAVATPSPRPLPSPDVQFPAVTYRFPKNLDALPDEVTQFTVTPPNLGTIAIEVAPIFGLSGQPEIVSSLKGTSYVWNKNQNGLLIGSAPPRLTYSSPHPASMPALTARDGELSVQAKNLLMAVSKDIEVADPVVRYYRASGDRITYTGRGEAQAIEFTYTFQLDGLRLLSGQPQTSQAIVRFDGAGTLRYLKTPIFRGIQKSEQSVLLLPPADTYQALLRGRGILYHAQAAVDTSEPDSKFYSFAEVNVRKAQSAYYYNAANTALLPVIIVHGVATDSQTKKEVETLTLVKAVR